MRAPSMGALAAAHPRVGGENLALGYNGGVGSGSSPRGRGKLTADEYREVYERLIPAWAGKTAVSVRERIGLRAHPRVGGENTLRQAAGPLMRGSSPRGRGKLRK